jgi:hypothetical protein
VVGYYFLDPYPSRYHGFFAPGEGGPLQDLGPMLGLALAINSNRQIAGDQYLWEGGTKYWLDDLLVGGSGWFLASAGAINDRGQIAGAACREESDVLRCFAVRLDPVALPEPAVSWLVLAGALVGLLQKSSLRRRVPQKPSLIAVDLAAARRRTRRWRVGWANPCVSAAIGVYSRPRSTAAERHDALQGEA